MDPNFDWSRRLDSDVRSQIVEYYYPLANLVTRKRLKGLSTNVDRDEIHSAANLGLLRAVDSYNPGKSSFRTYATMRISHTITDCLRDLDSVGRNHRSKINRHKQSASQLEQELGRPITEDDFLEHFGEARCQDVKGKQLEHFTSAQPISALHDNGFSRSESLREALKCLSMDEQTIVYLLYFKSARMKDIAMVFGISETRVSQIHSAVVKRLRNKRNFLVSTLVSR